MQKKKLQVFISSTFTDLRDERQAAVEAVLSSGHIPAGMELFSAGDESQMIVIKRWIEESDAYLLILGGRYGSLEPESQKSYTQLEYEYALELNKPFFAVVIEENALEDKVKKIGTAAIEKDYPQHLKDFRKNVLTKLVKFYSDVRDIKLAVYETLSEFSRREELVGWVRADELADNSTLVNQLSEITQKNKQLEAELKTYKDSNVSKIGNYTFIDLYNILRETFIHYPKEISGEKEDSEKSVLELFMMFHKYLSVGVSNSSRASQKEGFIVYQIAAPLRIYDLVEIVKVPNVAWSKYQTSKLGNQFLATVNLRLAKLTKEEAKNKIKVEK